MEPGMDTESRNGWRYAAELAGVMVVYVAVLYARRPLLAAGIGEPWRAIVLLAPALPIWGVFWVIIRHYRRLDEYLKQELLQIVAVCAGIAACVTSSYPFLKDAFDLPSMSIEYAWNVMAVCWLAATIFVQLRTRRLPAC
jgi:hypothetical protein